MLSEYKDPWQRGQGKCYPAGEAQALELPWRTFCLSSALSLHSSRSACFPLVSPTRERTSLSFAQEHHKYLQQQSGQGGLNDDGDLDSLGAVSVLACSHLSSLHDHSAQCTALKFLLTLSWQANSMKTDAQCYAWPSRCYARHSCPQDENTAWASASSDITTGSRNE